MADILGPINVTDVNRGVRAPDRGSEARAIGRALGAVETVVKGAVVEGVADDMTEELQDRVEDLRGPDADLMGPPSDLANDEGVQLKARVDKLVALRDQGKASQRDLAVMQLKQTLAEANMKYPWLRDELQRRAGQITQTSVELDRLGMYDAAIEAQGASAQAQLKDIQAHATKNWKDGGLGIDPSITVGSRQWVQQYTDRQKLRDANSVSQMINTSREVDATVLFDNAVNDLQGSISGTRLAYETIFQNNGVYDAIEQAILGEQGDPEVLRQFEQAGKATMIADLQQLNLNMTSVYEKVWEPRLINTEDGKALKKMLDDAIAQNNKMIDLAQDMANGVPGAAEALAAEKAVRSSNTYRGMTESGKNWLAFNSDPGNKTMIEVAGGDLTGEGQNFRQRYSMQAVEILKNINPTIVGPDASSSERAVMSFITSGQGAIEPGMSPGQIIDTLTKQQRDSSTPFYVPSNSDRDEQIGAATTMQLHQELFQSAKQVDGQSSPYKAATFATGVTSALIGLSGQTNRPQDLDQYTLENIASSDTFEMIEAVGDTEYSSQRRALGMAMKDYYARTKPDQRRARSIQAYNETMIGNAPLNVLVQIPATPMRTEGTLSYEINNEAFKREAQRRVSQDTGVGMSTPSLARVENEIVSEISDVMDPILAHAKQDLDIHMNINHATRPEFGKPSPGNMRNKYWDELGWLDGFFYTP